VANRDDIPKTDPSEIEALIRRLKQSNLEPHDTQLVVSLLQLGLAFVSAVKPNSGKNIDNRAFVPYEVEGSFFLQSHLPDLQAAFRFRICAQSPTSAHKRKRPAEDLFPAGLSLCKFCKRTKI
jgi:hypothetical protein